MKRVPCFACLLFAASLPSPANASPTFAIDDPQSWPFTPARDTFSKDAVFDFRSLNESTAGDRGFIRVSRDGDFVVGDGTPIRFWAVNFAPRVPLDDDQLAYAARFLAKRGVNMVRWHGALNPKVPGSGAFHHPPVGPDDPVNAPLPALEEIDQKERDVCWRLVAAMRREGIYLTLSPYWAVNFKHAHRFGLPGSSGGDRDAHGLLFFDPRMQAAYKQWLREWLLPPNPYTGIPLAQDPAVAVLQFQNEDSLLFWTVDGLAPEARLLLSRRFGKFLHTHHGSLDSARATWGESARDPGDNWSEGAPALLPLDHYRSTPPPALAHRLADQLEFYATTMRDANADLAYFVREELGVRAVLNANNWRTANGERMLDAERWSYLPAEALAANRYYSPPHTGRDNGWAVEPGHLFASISALRAPHEMPTAIRQVANRPMLVTESTWVMPTLYRAEGPLAVAAYLSLTGIDAYYWYALGYSDWTHPTFIDGRYQGAFKWTSQTPDVLGLFPAAALLFRRGDVRRGAPAVEETRALADLWAGQPPALNEEPGYDPNRDFAESSSTPGQGSVSALAYLVGPVHVRYSDGTRGETKVVDLSPWIDPQRGVVRSNTGEIELDYQHGLLRVDTPRAQGAAGFFNDMGDAVTTTHLRLTIRNRYAQVLAVSLDDQPLAESRNVLVQIGTTLRPTGWRTEPAAVHDRDANIDVRGERVVALGGPPWRIERTSGTLTLRNPHLTRAIVCDENATPLRELELTRSADELSVELPPDALYFVLR